jgi:signal transduction histidine kinase
MRTFTQTAARILILLFAIQIGFVALSFYSVQLLVHQTAKVNAEDTVLSITNDLREDLVVHIVNDNKEAFDFIIYELIQTKRLEYAGLVTRDNLDQFLRTHPGADICVKADLLAGKSCESSDGSRIFGLAPLAFDGDTLGYIVQQVSINQFVTNEAGVSFFPIGSLLGLVFILNVTGVLALLPRRLGKEIRKLQSMIHDETLNQTSPSDLTIKEFDDVAKVLKEASEARKKAGEVGRKAAKAQAMVSTAQMVAHDVRSPFSTIRAGMKLLSQVQSPADFSRIAAELDAELSRQEKSINNMLDDLLEVGRKVALVTEPRRLKPILDESLAIAARGKTFEAIWDLQHTYDVLVNDAKMVRVFANILGNAIEAIEAERVGERGRIFIRSKDSSDSTVTIEIANTGSIISDDIIDQIFDPFVSSGKSKGTGLGLAIAKKLVEDHDGKISVHSNRDSQTVTFTICLPAKGNVSK